MTPEDRKLLVEWGIYYGIMLCVVNESCTLGEVAQRMVEVDLLHPLAAKITTTWLLDVYRLGPFDRHSVTHICLRPEYKSEPTPPKRRPSCRY